MTAFVGLDLDHPIVNASGTLDAASAYRILGDATLGCAAHVTKTICPLAREGNPPPRIAETAGGMINSIGLPGPGVEAFAATFAALRAICLDVPIIVSVGGTSHDDYAVVVRRLADVAGIAALELNLSCPNVRSGCLAIGSVASETEALVGRVRALTRLPILVKLSPSVSDVAELVRAAAAAGADAVTLTNTARGLVIDERTGRPFLGGGAGGISGPPLRPLSLHAVATARAAEPGIAIVGLGGVETGRDAADLVDAGATIVGVGTAIFRDPGAPRRIRRELQALQRA